MLLPRNFNNGRVGLVSRIPDGVMTPLRVASRVFKLGEPENRTPSVQMTDDPRIANTSPPVIEFLSYSPTLTPPQSDRKPPGHASLDERMAAGKDHRGPLSFMPIQMSGFSAMMAIIDTAKGRLDSMVTDIKESVATRVRELAQKSGTALFGKLVDNIRGLEAAADAAYNSIESAEKKTDELVASAGEEPPAPSTDPPAPTMETPGDEAPAAAGETNPEETVSSQDAGATRREA